MAVLAEVLKVIFCHVVCCDISGSLTDRSIFGWHTILAAILKALFFFFFFSLPCHMTVTFTACSFWVDLDHRSGDREWLSLGPVFFPIFDRDCRRGRSQPVEPDYLNAAAAGIEVFVSMCVWRRAC